MPTDPSESFTDNWMYLKAELRWLDQILMVAVARQRKETHELERVAQSKADRATSAWWKGIIATEGKVAYDEHRQPSPSGPGGSKATYQQQLEQKIQVSRRKGVVLALPALRDRLGLTLFEKNLVLMSLAPEINRRYARLYRYLQGDDAPVKTDLPTLDLALRLLCRNDEEWRSARQRLVTTSPLVQYELLQLRPTFDNLLNCPLKLMDSLVNYLLAEQPTRDSLEQLLRLPNAPSPSPPTAQPIEHLQSQVPNIDWSQLVLPEVLISTLQALVQRQQGYEKAEARWGASSVQIKRRQGAIVLFAGDSGTGKATAAAAMAQALGELLYSVNLAAIDPNDYPQLLKEIRTVAPAVLLIKSAHLWFGRSTVLLPHQLYQFWQQQTGITILSTRQVSAVQIQWRQQCDRVLVFPKPSANDRLRLWQTVIPPQVPLSPNIQWKTLAKLALSGGEIAAIVQEAVLQAVSSEAEALEMQHLLKVLSQRGSGLALKLTAIGRSTPPHLTQAALKPAVKRSAKNQVNAKQTHATKATKPSKPKTARKRKATTPDEE
jgi:hypothetical protein